MKADKVLAQKAICGTMKFFVVSPISYKQLICEVLYFKWFSANSLHPHVLDIPSWYWEIKLDISSLILRFHQNYMYASSLML